MPSKAQRLLGVVGYNQRVNDIIFVPRTPSVEPASVVVFFGGDVQDYPENMKSHRDHGAHIEYNLEAVAELLAGKFPSSFVLVIRPAKIELKTFSCFTNFVNCNDIGSPTHEPNFSALLHLATLLLSVADQTNQPDIWATPLTLIGFSKGCIVLNQFLHEFHFFYSLPLDEGSLINAIVKRIQRMVWLDGGHSGGKDTWITSSAILSSISKLLPDISIDIHVTPYQVKDDRRPWIGKEEKQFHGVLKRLGIKLSRTMHFDEEIASLANHFRLLKLFS